MQTNIDVTPATPRVVEEKWRLLVTERDELDEKDVLVEPEEEFDTRRECVAEFLKRATTIAVGHKIAVWAPGAHKSAMSRERPAIKPRPLARCVVRDDGMMVEYDDEETARRQARASA